MEIKIEKIYGKVRNDRWGVIVEITNKDQVFKWLPTYKNVDELIKKLVEVELLNEELCKNGNTGNN